MGVDLNALIGKRLPDWIAMRRDFHQHPELGFTEFRTASIVAERLKGLGYSVRLGRDVMDPDTMYGKPRPDQLEKEMKRALSEGGVASWVDRMAGGMTGVVGELKRGPGPVVAFRFDIDALPIVEETTREHLPFVRGFASRHPGVMHACGHDGHTAIGLAVAEAAAAMGDRWRGTLKLIFQPAEEGGRGALPMVKAGVVEDADYFFAAHLGCNLPSGTIAAAVEKLLFSTKLDVTYRGRSAHAANNPQDGRNALLAGASCALALHAIARHGSEQTHVNVGRMVAGTARNAIAADCTMLVEVRGESDDSLGYMETRAQDIIEGTARQWNVAHSIERMGRTIGEPTDATSQALVTEIARTLPDVKNIVPSWNAGGSDDACYFIRRMHERGKYGAYFVVGSSLAAGHHATSFEFQEPDIAIGVQMLIGLLERLSRAG
ncbi:MAG: amidohydrolase [Alphaproteobacteria bacterium]|nr:amidohydrolase [Alphaproteobacteria bacterium]